MGRLKRAIQKAGRPTVNVLAIFSLTTGIPLYPLSRKSVVAIQTRGRKTGKLRLTPMGFVRKGDRILVVSEHGAEADWFRNARAGGSVQVLYGGKWFPATVRATDDPPREILALMPSRTLAAFNRLLWHRPRVVELRLRAGVEPTE